MTTTKIYLYPLWVRLWHWSNALCFLVLILSGLALHYPEVFSFLSFEIARLLHNIAGILLSLFYVGFLVGNFLTPNGKHYILNFRHFTGKLLLQLRYYTWGVFQGEDHPFETKIDDKFNPLQKLTYVFVMYVFLPLVVASGILLLFPESAPDEFLGMGGIWPVAIFHIAVGYILSFFMFAHIYLATHGETVLSNFEGMVSGYHDIHNKGKNP